MIFTPIAIEKIFEDFCYEHCTTKYYNKVSGEVEKIRFVLWAENMAGFGITTGNPSEIRSEYTILYPTLYKDFHYEKNDFVADFVKKCPRAKNLSPSIPCVLHELGHLQTMQRLNKKMPVRKSQAIAHEKMQKVYDNYIHFFYNKYQDKKKADTFLEKYINFTYYFRRPEEILATKWAINFIETHYEEVLELDAKIKEVCPS